MGMTGTTWGPRRPQGQHGVETTETTETTEITDHGDHMRTFWGLWVQCGDDTGTMWGRCGDNMGTTGTTKSLKMP